MLTTALRIVLTRSFKPFVFKCQYENKLEYEYLENLGIYVHIPFCESICSFCPYCKEKYNKEKAIKYKKALLKEIDLVCKYSNKKKEVTSLYFGGGTPLLMVDDLKDIIKKLNNYFIFREGIGVELHPRDITRNNLMKLKEAKVSMISIGIQSFNNECLKKIGREDDNFKEKLLLIDEFNFQVVDIDLIFGIPGQNEEILKNDISTAFKYGATQVSTYPFIDFTFADNKYKPMSHLMKKKMLKSLIEISKKLKLERTSVWTFAKPNTKKYSSVTRDNFLGFGISATTLLKNSFKINTFSIDGYIERVNNENLPTSLTLSFTKRQRAVYFLFWSAYSLIINERNFEGMIGKSLKNMYWIEFFVAEKLGFLTNINGNYYLTEKASYIYHYIEQQYTTAYIDKMWNISRIHAFPEKIILK